MAGAGKKTFVAGETLTASDVNSYLMEQSVMVFGGTAARASAIPTPSTGMTSYIGVTGTASIPQIETYTGSEWQTPYGLTQLANVSFTAAGTISIQGVFSSLYDNYRVEFSTSLTTNANVPIGMRMLTGSTPLSSVSYGYASFYSTTSGTSGNLVNSTGDTYMRIGQVGNNTSGTSPTVGSLEIYNPFRAVKTVSTHLTNSYYGSGDAFEFGGGVCVNATSYDGVQFLCASGAMTGTVRIYGYRNS